MGATWLTAAFAVWMWLFRPGSAIGFGSRKLELVDKLGDPKSIFEKIRFILRHLPPWLLEAQAAGFDLATHATYCRIINPANGSTITGEGGGEIGRGGRTTVYFVDEAAFLPHPLLVDQALSSNSRCRVYVSTPRGAGTPFAVKRHSGRYPVLTLHWRDDPRRSHWAVVRAGWVARIDETGALVLADDDVLARGLGTEPPPALLDADGCAIDDGTRMIYPWWEEVQLKEDPLTIAREYEIDYSASLEGVIVPARWLRACVGLALPRGQRVAGYDVAAGGTAENVYLMRAGPVVERIVRWRDEDPTRAAFHVVRLAEEDRVHRLLFDSIGVGAGTAGAIRLMRRRLTFACTGINVGVAPTRARWPDGQTSQEKFANLKIELWWRLRMRAERTYQHVTLGASYPPEDLLSLPPGPDTEALIAQVSNVRFFETETGKTVAESKRQLAERGVVSPDIAEALVLSLAAPAVSSSPTRSGDARRMPAPDAPRPRRTASAGTGPRPWR